MLAVLTNWLLSSHADDGHPHELLHQAPAEPVHKAGVWYNVSSHLLGMAISFLKQSAADAGVAAEFTLPKDEVALTLPVVTVAEASWLLWCHVSYSSDLRVLFFSSTVCGCPFARLLQHSCA